LSLEIVAATMSVLREDEGPVTIVRIDRPDAMNSFDQATVEDLADTLGTAMREPGTEAIVLAGGGDVFCTGADLTTFAAAVQTGQASDVVREVSSTMNEAIMAIVDGDKPVLGRIDGPAAGGGLGLALACDLRIASPQASFTPAFLGVGISPDGGATWWLPRMIGEARARRLILQNETVTAEDADEWGLVSEVVDEDEIAEHTLDVARELAEGPSQAIADAKRHLGAGDELRAHLEAETETTAASADTEDFAEGVEAFLEGREPAFDGDH
jgi:2-(1,2-epoxy-1,2-dihydrophenyl)acetyl-CoA isomerase